MERTTDHCHSVEPHRGIIRGVAGQTNSTLRGKLTLAVPGKDTISNVWIANTGTGKYSLACVSAIATELKLNLLFDNKGVYLLTTSNKVDYKKGRMIGQLRCGLYHVFDDFLISQTTTSEPVKDFYHFTAKNRCKQYAIYHCGSHVDALRVFSPEMWEYKLVYRPPDGEERADFLLRAQEENFMLTGKVLKKLNICVEF